MKVVGVKGYRFFLASCEFHFIKVHEKIQPAEFHSTLLPEIGFLFVSLKPFSEFLLVGLKPVLCDQTFQITGYSALEIIRISGIRIVLISGIRPDIENGRIS